MFYFLICVIFTFNFGGCYYLPGLTPVNYCSKSFEKKLNNCKSSIPLYANKLTSSRSLISSNFKQVLRCGTAHWSGVAENLGQVFSERLVKTKYSINFLENKKCSLLCKDEIKDHDQHNFLLRSVVLQYSHHWSVDSLPVTICVPDVNSKMHCSTSIPLGCFGKPSELKASICTMKDTTKAYLLNHITLRVKYHHVDGYQRLARIVGITAIPRSIDHQGSLDCTSTLPLSFQENLPSSGFFINYTYSVEFVESQDIVWASRWDYILESIAHSNIHWMSILNSVTLVILLSGLVAVILIRTLRRDFARYSELESMVEFQEESGWKLVHGDVFRPPSWNMLLSVLVGSGSQLFVMVIVTLFFACIGFFNPVNRGALMTCALAMFACSGMFAGYASAKLYKFFGGLRWKTCVLMTALFCPTVVFSTFFIINLALWIMNSATAVPFTAILKLLSLWLFVSLPLCFGGALFGFRKSLIEVPVRTNQIPRQIPRQTTFSGPLSSFFLGGLLSFTCIFVQLFFIFNSIWGTQIYYMFGLLFVVFILLLLTTSEAAILLCYLQLCSEDYRWYWRSFYSSAGTSFYFVIYSLHYFFKNLEYRDGASVFLYFGYISIIMWLMFILTGTIGFFASFWFVRKIYAVLKVD